MKAQKILSLFLLISLFFIVSCKGNNFEKALAYQTDGEYEKAIDFYNRAIQKNDNAAEAEKNVGDIYFSHEQYEYAFECYGRAIELESEAAMDTVIKFSSFRDEEVRSLVAKTLSNIKNQESTEIIFGKLVDLLKGEDTNKVIDTLEIILNLKRDISPISGEIISLLDSENLVIKQKALLILPKFPKIVCENEECFNKIIGYLSQKNEIIKATAIDCLGDMKKYAKKALPVLIDVAAKDSINKERALNAVNKIGIPTKEKAANMYEFFKDKPNDVKIKFLESFENAAGKDDKVKEYVPNILTFLKYDDFGVKQKTRSVLTKIGKASETTIPELINLLKEDNTEIVSRSIYELGDFGKAASDAIEPLKQLIETTKNDDIKKKAKDALQKIQ